MAKKIKNVEKEPKKHDVSKIFGKILAGLLALLMVLAVSATLIYCLINQ